MCALMLPKLCKKLHPFWMRGKFCLRHCTQHKNSLSLHKVQWLLSDLINYYLNLNLLLSHTFICSFVSFVHLSHNSPHGLDCSVTLNVACNHTSIGKLNILLRLCSLQVPTVFAITAFFQRLLIKNCFYLQYYQITDQTSS